jgi:hypothetical protein
MMEARSGVEWDARRTAAASAFTTDDDAADDEATASVMGDGTVLTHGVLTRTGSPYTRSATIPLRHHRGSSALAVNSRRMRRSTSARSTASR